MLLQESIFSEDDIDLDGNAMLTEKPKYNFDDLLEQVQVLLLAFHHAVQPFCFLYCNAGPRLPCPTMLVTLNLKGLPTVKRLQLQGRPAKLLQAP